jgi:hypothetical protein
MIIILHDNNHIIYIIMRASTCNDSNDHDNKDLYLGFGINFIYVGYLCLGTHVCIPLYFKMTLASVSRNLLHLRRVCRRKGRCCLGATAASTCAEYVYMYVKMTCFLPLCSHDRLLSLHQLRRRQVLCCCGRHCRLLVMSPG